MKIASTKAKKVLAEYLKEHDPDTLDFIVEASKVFGPLPWVEYDNHPELLRRLRDERDRGL